MDNPAGFWIRFGAALLDGIIIGLPLGIISFLLFGESDTWFTTIGQNFYSFILPILWVGYTIGKRIVGVRVVKVDGSNVDVWTMVKRVLIAGIVYGITLGIGLIVSCFMVGLRADKRSLHDFIAGTYVTHDLPYNE